MKSPLPKVLHPIAGKPMIEHVMDNLAPINPKKTIIVVGKDSGFRIQDSATNHSTLNSQLSPLFVIQKQQLGTGHAVKQAESELKNFKGVALVLYADTPLITTATMKKMAAAIDNKTAVAVLGFEPEDAGAYGRLVVTPSTELLEIVEFKDATAKQKSIKLCNSGVMAVNAELLFDLLAQIKNNNAKGEYYLTDIVAIARKSGYKCKVVMAEEDEVMGVNSQGERAKAEAILQNKLRNKAMENGVMMIAPETVFLSTDTELAEGVIIHPNVVFGKGVKVGKNVEIKSFSHIDGAVIKAGAIVGPYARLRPGAEIGENAHIGNFVEVKKSKIGKGAKANHLSYIGDSDVGENSNIGAGTITCNYDGYNKFETKIGKGAFIGSNSSLVAPVKIGDGAIIGAGSTILKDVPKDAVAVSQTPQKNMPGKAAAYRKGKKKK